MRMWCVLAVLAGLFAMHGLASSQAEGCHLSAGMISATAMPGPMAATTHPTMRQQTGSMCLFVAPAGWPPLALTLLALVTLAALIDAGALRAPWVSGRSPPDSGVSVLRRVCVSRT